MDSIYRDSTLEYFRNWKHQYLLREYQKGNIGIKHLCKLGNLTLHQAAQLLEKNDIEPPISEFMEEYTERVAKELTVETLFKDGKVPKRESREIFIDE